MFIAIHQKLRRMFSPTKRSKETQSGLTMVETIGSLFIIGLVALVIIPRVGAMIGKSKVELAQTEITTLITESTLYGLANGGYTGMTMGTLISEGHQIPPFITATTPNVFSQAVTVTAASGGGNFIVSYPTDNLGTCNQLESRISKLRPAQVTVAACPTSGLMTITAE